MKVVMLLLLMVSLAGAEYVPSAQDKDKAAVFGYMIRRMRAEKSGIPVGEMVQRSAYPWCLAGLLLPFYLWTAAHRARVKA